MGTKFDYFRELAQPRYEEKYFNNGRLTNIHINNKKLGEFIMTEHTNMVNNNLGKSKFDGGLLSYIGWNLLGTLITVCTFGICLPWAICMVYGWKINHTIIEGRRLKFTGTAISLFGQWIKWLLLCIITLGIYSFWIFISLEKWKVKHTTFAN